MNINDIKKEIKTIFFQKNPSQNKYKKTFKLLKLLENNVEEQEYYNNCKGKLLLKQNKFRDAKYYFLEELNLNSESLSAYYNLFKIDVLEGDLKEAYLDLFNFYNRNDASKVDVSLPLTMIEACLDLDYNPEIFFNTDYKVPLSSKLYTCNFYKEDLKRYHEIITDFNNRDFIKLKFDLQEFNNIVNKQNIPVDLDCLIELVDHITCRISTLYDTKIVEQLEKEEDLDPIFKKQLSNNILHDKFKIHNTINYLDKLIIKDPFLVTDIIETLTANKKHEEYKTELTYLKNKSAERIKYLQLSDSDKEVYDRCILEGKKSYRQHNLFQAMDYYQYGQYLTEHPIFDYYIGKILFKNGSFNEAYPYFMKYEQCGGNKLLQTLLYLWAIDSYKGNYKKAQRRQKKTRKIVTNFDSNKKWKMIPQKKKDDPDFDCVKYKAYKNIHMEPADFNTANLELEEFDTYSFNDKIGVIRNLYRTNHIEMADKLLKKLEISNNSSFCQKKLNQEKKLKKLYINQAKKQH